MAVTVAEILYKRISYHLSCYVEVTSGVVTKREDITVTVTVEIDLNNTAVHITQLSSTDSKSNCVCVCVHIVSIVTDQTCELIC